MPTDADGLGAAAAQLVDAAPSREEEQSELFASSPLFGGLKPVEARRGPGRPPGSENRNTSEWVAFIQRNYRSPLLFLADITVADTFDLAKRMRCKPIEALAMQKAAAGELAPYLHRKQPIAIDAGEGVPMPSIVHALISAHEVALMTQGPQNKGETGLTPLLIEGEVAAPKVAGSEEASTDD